MTVQEALKRFRKDFGYTQKQVADELEISQQAYQLYESRSYPSAEVIMKLAKNHGISADYLLGLSDIPKPAAVPNDSSDKVTAAALAFAAALREQFNK